MSTMREEFEAYMLRCNVCTRLARQSEAVGGQYRTTSVERAWQQWQAAYVAGQRSEREECALPLYRVVELDIAPREAAVAAIRARDKEQG